MAEPRILRDRIVLRDLLVRGIVGVNDWEREQEQDILVNLEVATDTRAAGRSDDVADTLNYRTLAKAVIEHVESARPYLVEALAEWFAEREELYRASGAIGERPANATSTCPQDDLLLAFGRHPAWSASSA